ncbi:MAG TPA: enoyl-CoA hydratase-related protein [Bacteroidota bacterium]|nr:enoyl-CoA hydratase-related protein [Bacteroidota bacterium]
MNYTTLTCTVTGRTATVTMNRPERRNALNETLIRELTDVFTSLNKNPGVRVVLLTGAGGAFCAGMDLDHLVEYARLDQGKNLEDAQNLLRLLLLLHQHKKAVVAVVNGPALGGGCGLAAACDFVYAGAEKGLFGVPEVRLGFVPAVILFFLVKRMGSGAAREFVLKGGKFGSSEALAAGLVSEIVPDAELLTAAGAFAEHLAATTSPSSVTLTKELFGRFDDMKPSEALEYATALNALSRKTDDFRKGMEAFLAKEKLQW